MNYEDYIPDALAIVDAWEVPEEVFTQTVNDQARLMAGLNLEPSIDLHSCSPYSPLRF